MKRTGIKDIAKRARVSLASVSRFLNDGENFSIRESTKRRIRKAVAELNYVPDHAARSLKSGKRETIGVILNHIDAHMTALVAEIEICLSREKHMLLIASSEGDVRREMELMNTMRRRTDALLVVSHFDGTERPDEYRRALSGIPIVFVDSTPALDDIIASVTGDNQGDAFRAVRYFMDSGVSEYCFVRSRCALPVLMDRFAGFSKALSEKGIALHDGDIFTSDAPQTQVIIDRIRKAASAPLVFFESLLPSEQFISACADAGLVIGRDAFVCGFDEPIIENPFASLKRLSPAIASPIPYILQDRKTISQIAVDAALTGARPAAEKVPGIFMNFDISRNKESV